jgi:hypothetical protein
VIRAAVRGTALAAVIAVVCACSLLGGRPSSEQMTVQVARLTLVLPLLEELRVSEFERGRCQVLVYGRGAFVGDGETCITGAAPFDGIAPFDDVAAADHARIAAALNATGVPTDRIELAPGRSGDRETVRFILTTTSVRDAWAYVYDPGDSQSKAATRGAEYLRIDRDWSFVVSPDS